MRKFFVVLPVALFCLVAFLTPAQAIDKQVVAGAGPSTTVADLFFREFSSQPEARNIEFIVPPMSTKHAGGIENSNSYLFGRTGRPLNDKERAQNKKDLFLAKVPIAFATGEAAKHNPLTLADIEKIFRGEITNWSALGGPNVAIVTIGREPTEALFMELKEDYPFFKEAKFNIVFKKDDEVVNFLKSPVGTYAIAFGAKPNFADVKTINIPEATPGVRLGLVYDAKNENDPVVKAAILFASSNEWRQMVVAAGLIPVNKTTH